uniref:Uncharacterized protein n=1 Tax=viral metagenome TaxID=1070528 RepID=A0A6H1ZY37_9ZZZZ
MYSKEEIKNFADKDLRISKLAILKSLIDNCSEEEIYEVKKVTELAERYIDYVYAERKDAIKRGQASCVAGDNTEGIKWEQVAQGLNLAKPNAENTKILNRVLDAYKQVNKASANPSDVLVHIVNAFGAYPTKTESVKIILKSLNKEN